MIGPWDAPYMYCTLTFSAAGTKTVGPDGSVSFSVRLPDNFETGEHRFEVRGIAEGSSIMVFSTFTVVADEAGAGGADDGAAGGLPASSPLNWSPLMRWSRRVVHRESEVVAAVRFAWSEHRLVVEPGGAVALAALLTGRVEPAEGTVVVLSGGNVDPALHGCGLSDQGIGVGLL